MATISVDDVLAHPVSNEELSQSDLRNEIANRVRKNNKITELFMYIINKKFHHANSSNQVAFRDILQDPIFNFLPEPEGLTEENRAIGAAKNFMEEFINNDVNAILQIPFKVIYIGSEEYQNPFNKKQILLSQLQRQLAKELATKIFNAGRLDEASQALIPKKSGCCILL